MQGADLAYVTAAGRGVADGLLTGVATALTGHRRLCGVVQINTEYDPDRPCHMDLAVLGTASVIRISQVLGPKSQGCRLDAAGLEGAVGMVEATLRGALPDLLILNKFGKQECDGRGFRPLIGQALAMGVPVLTAVPPEGMPGFMAFADGMAIELAPEPAAILRWCETGYR